MESNAQARGMPPGSEQQCCCRRRFGPKLAGQVEDRVALRQRQPHDEAKRAGDAGGPRLVEDLGRLGSALAEMASASRGRGDSRVRRMRRRGLGTGRLLAKQRNAV